MFSYLGFRFFQSFLALLPLRVVYAFSNGIAWILQHIIKYRSTTIHDNLLQAFPTLPETELKRIIKASYQNLADTSLESLIGTGFSAAELKERMLFLNPEIIPPNEHVIVIGGHQGNWEWGGLAVPLWFSQQVVGVYKPMKQKKIDAYFKEKRKQWGLRLLSMRATYKFLKEENDPTVLVLIADQSPGNARTSIWTPFFHQPAAFNVGPEKIAKEKNWPIYFYAVKRVARGKYEVQFKLLEKNPQTAAPGQITRKFRDALEETIREQPEDWLWSHKRWKKTLPNGIHLYE